MFWSKIKNDNINIQDNTIIDILIKLNNKIDEQSKIINNLQTIIIEKYDNLEDEIEELRILVQNESLDIINIINTNYL